MYYHVITFYLLADIMSRAALLYGEEALLDEYNKHVTENFNEKSSKTMRKSASSVGFTRGFRQMIEDIENYDPGNSYLGVQINVGGLLDTKKHFYRLVSSLVTDLGLVLDIRSPSPWQVISELQNQDIIGQSDSANFKVCLSIANEIRLKAYFANGGQKELFSPLRPSPDTTEQSTDDPIFRNFDEDTLVRLLTTSYDLHRRCREFCLKYVQQDEVDASILRNPVFRSKALVMSHLYSRLQKFPKALECLKSISKDSPEYAECANVRGNYHLGNCEYKKAIECYETALEYSQDPSDNLWFQCNFANCLLESRQHEKAKDKLEEAMKLHDEIYGKGSETRILSQLMILLGIHFYRLLDMPSAIKTFRRVEQMQKRMTRCSDIDVINLNLYIAMSCSKFGQNDQSLDYLDRVLRLGHKIFGKHNLSSELLKIYMDAAIVYRNCDRYDKALSLVERSLQMTESLGGDTVHQGTIVVTF